MQMSHTARRLALGTTIAAFGLLALGGTALAGTVTQTGTTLTYTSAAGQADSLRVTQTDPTTITFADDTAALTESADNCAVVPNADPASTGDDVECTGMTWTAVALTGGDGNDYLNAAGIGTTVSVTLNGDAGRDSLFGGDGNDIVNGGDGNDSLMGEAGNDTMVGGDGADEMYGYLGNDTLSGGAGPDTISGADGIDTLNGDAGNDQLFPGDHVTTSPDPAVADVFGPDGSDVVNGGDGFDTVLYVTRTTDVSVDLATAGGDGAAGENDNVALDVEGAEGGYGNDTLMGSSVTNTLIGNGGNDTIDGRDGFDQLEGRLGVDTINASGDVFADLVDCGSNPAGAELDVANLDYLDILSPTADCETVNRAKAPSGEPQTGTRGDDVMIGSTFADLLIGGLGNDTLRGGTGNDDLFGGAGNDKLYGFDGNDMLDGAFGNDALAGQAGADRIDGGPGNDKLSGGPGVDVLSGGIGADRLDGGEGRDFLVARDGSRAVDVVICSKVASKYQRDTVVADKTDRIVNRAWCGRIAIV